MTNRITTTKRFRILNARLVRSLILSSVMMDVVIEMKMSGPMMPEIMLSSSDLTGDATSSRMKLLTDSGRSRHRNPSATPRMTASTIGFL